MYLKILQKILKIFSVTNVCNIVSYKQTCHNWFLEMWSSYPDQNNHTTPTGEIGFCNIVLCQSLAVLQCPVLAYVFTAALGIFWLFIV